MFNLCSINYLSIVEFHQCLLIVGATLEFAERQSLPILSHISRPLKSGPLKA